MKVLKNIGLGLLGVILLGGCTLNQIKKANQVCGENPTIPLPADGTFNNLDDLRQDYFDVLAEKPISYLECRSTYFDRPASYVLGMEYLKGERVEENPTRAARLFEIAGKPKNGNQVYYVPGIGGSSGYTASYNTGQGTPGMMDAQYQLGLLYLEGTGVAQSTEKAKKWLKRAARQGHAGAKNLLSELENGDHV